MQTTILIVLLAIVAILTVMGSIYEDGKRSNPRLGRLCFAAGFGILAIAGLVVYGVDDQRGLFSIGVAGLFCAVYLVRALRTSKK